MANAKNLIPLSERSPSELREMRSKGGKKSGETRRKKRDAKKLLHAMLSEEVPNKGMTYEEYITLTLLRVACDISHPNACINAFKTIVHMLGEDIPEDEHIQHVDNFIQALTDDCEETMNQGNEVIEE